MRPLFLLREYFFWGGMTINYISNIKRLTHTFFIDYDEINYPEILRKEQRPYNVVLIKGLGDYFLCVPFRTNIRHKYAYHFKRTNRSKAHKSGLDYQKMIIINQDSYIDSVNNIIIDNDEYIEYITNLDKINQEALQFLQDYIDYRKMMSTISFQEFERRYKFSPLQYFDSIIIKPC